MIKLVRPSPGRSDPWLELEAGYSLPPDIGEAAFELGRSKAMQASYVQASTEEGDAAYCRGVFWGHDVRGWAKRLIELHEEHGSAKSDIVLASHVSNFVMNELRVWPDMVE